MTIPTEPLIYPESGPADWEELCTLYDYSHLGSTKKSFTHNTTIAYFSLAVVSAILVSVLCVWWIQAYLLRHGIYASPWRLGAAFGACWTSGAVLAIIRSRTKNHIPYAVALAIASGFMFSLAIYWI